MSLSIGIDTHTHTILSGHAFSTLNENVEWAQKKGLSGICLTEHGPRIPGGVTEFFPAVQLLLPKNIGGVQLYFGVEANICAYDGSLDISDSTLNQIDFVIASFHGLVLDPSCSAKNTEACLCALHNPAVDVIGHPCYPGIPCDLEILAKEAALLGKALELNNNSIRSGMASESAKMLRLCRKYGTSIVVSSDAHYCRDIGNFDLAAGLIKELAFPTEFIRNRSKPAFETFIQYCE